MEESINRIRERGNWVAHLGQKYDKSMAFWSEGKTSRLGNRWITEGEVRLVLEDALTLLNTMISKHMAPIGEDRF
jgi:hypothetical protein